MGYIEQVKDVVSEICTRSGQVKRYEVLITYLNQIESGSDLMRIPQMGKAYADFGARKLTISHKDPAEGVRSTIDIIVSTAIKNNLISYLTPDEKEVLRPLLCDLIEKDLFNYNYAILKLKDGSEEVHRFRSRQLLNLWQSTANSIGAVTNVKGVPSVDIPKHEPEYWLWIEQKAGHEVLKSTESVLNSIEITGQRVRVIDPNVHARQLLGI